MTELLMNQLGIADLIIRLEKTWGSDVPENRAAIRAAVFQLHPDSPEVKNLDLLPKLRQHTVSISHTRMLGGFAIATGIMSLGFDLECTARIEGSQLKRVSRYQEEVTLAPAPNYLWTAKEASFKALSPLSAIRVLSDVKIQDWVSLSKDVFQYKATLPGINQTLSADGVCWQENEFSFSLARLSI